MIHQEINKSSILLLTEICELMSICMSYKKSLVDLIVRESDVIQALVSLLNVDLFGECFKLVPFTGRFLHVQTFNLFFFCRIHSKAYQTQMLAKSFEGSVPNRTFTHWISNYLRSICTKSARFRWSR